ncbi:putative leucine-rich repeat domain superfamily, winged helix-like DNA-binding domain superfamily [Helianthus debilis subsp. tardiflorus]
MCVMEMEVKVVLAVLILKLRDTLNEEGIANNKIMTCQLKQVQKSLENLQNLSDDFDKSQKSRDYLRVLYEVEDEIEKFSFQVARQRKRFGFLMNQTFLFNNLNSCRMLIRKLNNLMTKIYCFLENQPAATPISSSITSSSAIWPIPTTPSPKRGPLTRSFSTISNLPPQKKKLTVSLSYNNDNVLPNVHDHQCSNEVVAKRYDDLRIDLKPCLLYLALFPKDYNVPVRRLLRLWLAEGFVERNPSPEDVVQKHFEDLVDQGMIQITKFRSDNSPKQCCLVPEFHDYLLPKAQEIGLFSIHHNLEHLEDAAGPFGVRRMIQQMGPTTGALTNSNSVWAHKLDPSILRSYVSFNRPRKDMPAIEVGLLLGRIVNSDFRLLKVLDLEGVNRPTLPNKLDHLYLLKYLGLRRTYLDNLPESVGKLYHLETLDLKHTNIDSLPNSIWKLKHLRYLNLNNVRLSMPPSSSSTLVTLWGLVLDDKISANELEGLLMLLNLRELGIKFQLTTRSQGVLLNWIQKLVDLQSLRLFSVNGSGQASKLVLKTLATLNKLSHLNLYGNLEGLPTANEFPPTVKVLTLSISQLKKDPMETLGQLPCLIVLRLLGDSFMGKRMVCLRGGFKQLEVLKMWKLEGLEEWDVEEEAMESLKELDIRCCHKLKNIPCRLLIKPKRLEILKLTDMPDDFVDRIKRRISTDTTLTAN